MLHRRDRPGRARRPSSRSCRPPASPTGSGASRVIYAACVDRRDRAGDRGRSRRDLPLAFVGAIAVRRVGGASSSRSTGRSMTDIIPKASSGPVHGHLATSRPRRTAWSPGPSAGSSSTGSQRAATRRWVRGWPSWWRRSGSPSGRSCCIRSGRVDARTTCAGGGRVRHPARRLSQAPAACVRHRPVGPSPGYPRPTFARLPVAGSRAGPALR